MVKGWFEESFPEPAPSIERIAILHADGDWYESVKLTLETSSPRSSPGGFVVIDDYGDWEGAKEATHEYRAERGIDASARRGRPHGGLLAQASPDQST